MRGRRQTGKGSARANKSPNWRDETQFRVFGARLLRQSCSKVRGNGRAICDIIAWSVECINENGVDTTSQNRWRKQLVNHESDPSNSTTVSHLLHPVLHIVDRPVGHLLGQFVRDLKGVAVTVVRRVRLITSSPITVRASEANLAATSSGEEATSFRA